MEMANMLAGAILGRQRQPAPFIGDRQIRARDRKREEDLRRSPLPEGSITRQQERREARKIAKRYDRSDVKAQRLEALRSFRAGRKPGPLAGKAIKTTVITPGWKREPRRRDTKAFDFSGVDCRKFLNSSPAKSAWAARREQS